MYIQRYGKKSIINFMLSSFIRWLAYRHVKPINSRADQMVIKVDSKIFVHFIKQIVYSLFLYFFD